MARGEANWMTVRRCLAIVRRAMRGPATWKELVKAACEELGPDAYGRAEGERLRRLFDDDLARLRQKLRIDLRSDQGDQRYRLRSAGPGLIDLPDEGLEAVLVLCETFPADVPGAAGVVQLLDTVVSYLPPDRQRRLLTRRVPVSIDVRHLDEDDLDQEVLRKVEQAVRERRLLRFDYLSPSRDQPQPRRHTVAPDDHLTLEEGHLYLYGYSQRCEGPSGTFSNLGVIKFRVQYIQPGTVELLPDRVPDSKRRRRRYELRYELYGPLARGAVSERFDEMEVERDEAAGVVRVKAVTDDLFGAVQTLLRYGRNCKVLAPPEAVRMMREHVAGMARLYEIDLSER